MKLWKDMTPEEKGALLLASHEGKTLQYWKRGSGGWEDCLSVVIHESEYYRVKPAPVITEVVMHGCKDDGVWSFDSLTGQAKWDTHKITFNLVDGVVDVFSVRMEEL